MIVPGELPDETVKVGIKKAKSSFSQLLILGIFAGMFIAIGGFAAAMISHSIENVGLSKFAGAVVFPTGLMLVLICGGELFTGNTLMSVALLEKKIRFREMLRNWIIVYIANFIGALLIAYLVFSSGSLDTNGGKLGGYVIKVAVNKGGLSFMKALASGILCNILVSLGVWGANAAKDIAGKILIIWFPVMLFVLSGFEHSVANMYYFSIGMLAKSNQQFVEASHVGEKISNLDLGHVIGNLIPVTLGNIIGGAVFVGMAYWLAYKYIPGRKASNLKPLENNEKRTLIS